jgi:hypothetical protein
LLTFMLTLNRSPKRTVNLVQNRPYKMRVEAYNNLALLCVAESSIA